MTNKITIPEKHVEFCRAVAKMAEEAGYSKLGLSLTPGYKDEWSAPLQMSWDRGRHGSDSQDISISSTLLVNSKTTARANGD